MMINNLPQITPSGCPGSGVWAPNCSSTSAFWASSSGCQPFSWSMYIFPASLRGCLPACQLLWISTPGLQLARPPPAPSRGRARPRIRQALCPEGLRLLLGAGGRKSKRRRSSGKQLTQKVEEEGKLIGLIWGRIPSAPLPISDQSLHAWLPLSARADTQDGLPGLGYSHREQGQEEKRSPGIASEESFRKCFNGLCGAGGWGEECAVLCLI